MRSDRAPTQPNRTLVGELEAPLPPVALTSVEGRELTVYDPGLGSNVVDGYL